MQIETSIVDGTNYYIMESRGTRYTLSWDRNWNQWSLHSKRLAYGGKFNTGSHRFFATLEDLERAIKAFRGIALVVSQES